MPEILWQDENAHLAVTIYQDASAAILDKASDTRWHMGRVALQEDGPIDVGHVWLRTQRSICEQYPGRFQGHAEGNQFRFTLLGRERREVGQFSCHVQLDGPKLTLRISHIDETLPSLVFPPPIESESLVLPRGVGQWVRKPLWERYFWVFPAHLNMRWFGGLQGDQGWLAIVEEGYTDAGVLATQLSASPGWLKSLDHWTGSRTISYQFVGGGYVGLAKAFRAYALEHGLHRSLTEKIAATPALRNFLGGPILSFMQARTFHPERFEDRLEPPRKLKKGSDQNQADQDTPEIGKPLVMVSHAQVKHLLEQALSQGLPHAQVAVRGWIQGGYDETHPDVWPPDPAVGSIPELTQLLALHDALTVALHDNYQDIYQQSPSWPHGVIRTATGDPMPGGLWAGGQAYILNTRAGLAYARRNWEQIKTLQPRSMFIDTTTAVQFYQSYEPNDQLTRAQDEQLKIELLRFYKEQGQVLGSEEAADFGLPWVDWLENRHHRVPGESIPLWPLVFHDAAFCARYGPLPTYPESRTSSAPRWLTDMLWGYTQLFGFSESTHWQESLDVLAALPHARQWHQQIGTEEMLSHRYLSEDGEVEETTFSSGKAILVNFSPEPREIEGQTIPAHNFIIR